MQVQPRSAPKCPHFGYLGQNLIQKGTRTGASRSDWLLPADLCPVPAPPPPSALLFRSWSWNLQPHRLWFCSVMLKNGTTICLDPNAVWVKLLTGNIMQSPDLRTAQESEYLLRNKLHLHHHLENAYHLDLSWTPHTFVWVEDWNEVLFPFILGPLAAFLTCL